MSKVFNKKILIILTIIGIISVIFAASIFAAGEVDTDIIGQGQNFINSATKPRMTVKSIWEDLKPIASLKSKVTFLKEVEPDTSIGYSRSYKTTRTTMVATVPIGYADGFRRTFSNGWEVLINGQRAKIIGKVCMDSFMADVTDIPDVKVGDDVYIWDNENIKLEDLSDKCDTINYEIISQIGERVPRKFI